MRTSHRLLLRFYHDPGYDFSRVRIEYVDRGAPSDRSAVQGDRILALDAQYLEVDAGTHVACIPYHRIRRILYDGEVVWNRDWRERSERQEREHREAATRDQWEDAGKP